MFFRFLLFMFCGAIMGDSLMANTMAVQAGTVTWHAMDSLGLTKIDGEGGKATGTVVLEKGMASGIFECAMADFTTGIGMRDDHMKNKFLMVGKYPKAVLKLDPVAASGEVDWTGQLTLKDATKAVKGHAHIAGGLVEAKFTINTDDFNIGSPAFAGVQFGKTVEITVRAEAK